jgi:hypothetical protein
MIFSDARAFEAYKNATGQQQAPLYSIKVEAGRIFGADLSAYEMVVVDSHSARAARFGREDFAKLNEMHAAFEIERTLIELGQCERGAADYAGDYYLEVGRYRKFIVPLKNGATEPAGGLFAAGGEGGEKHLPVFTAPDNYEAFRRRLLETLGADEAGSIEPFLIGGAELCRILISDPETRGRLVFNPDGPARPVAFAPNFALKVYCA